MATYPQGVSSFIPDYQPFEPDLNFAANVLQLKQTQYDQNWQKINNIYGQIVNAPLSHPESIRRRMNTVNAIDFDLQRVSGLDLSLDQNVHQATQIFRPFYEDQNLMKDIVFTKNAGFERALGEGKRISTDEKVRAEYWENGLNYIDQKVQEFKSLPYDQLTKFQDVQYVPYVNVEKKALELADKMNYSIDMATPNGQWVIREKNGKPLIPKLQSIFYSILGEDPMIRKVYDVQSYLHRKNVVASEKDTKYGGDEMAAERAYLNGALKTLRKQSQQTSSGLLDEKKTNDQRILKLQHQIAKGDKSKQTAEDLTRFQEANQHIEKLLKQNESDLKMISSDVNRTATTRGGSQLSFDDLENMRMRVDAVVASNMLQADLDKAAEDFAYKDYALDYEANPFAIQHQKYLYDSALIDKRKEAQKDVEDHKAKIASKQKLDDERMKTGAYYRDPETLEVKLKPELEDVAPLIENLTKTGAVDPIELEKIIQNTITSEAIDGKQKMHEILDNLLAEGLLSTTDIAYIIDGEKGGLGFDYKPFMNWLTKWGEEEDLARKLNPDRADPRLLEQGLYQTALDKEMGYDPTKERIPGSVPKEIRDIVIRQGIYKTNLEKEAAMEMGTPLYTTEEIRGFTDKEGNVKVEGLLSKFQKGNLEDVSPTFVLGMKQRLDTVLENLSSYSWVYGSKDYKDLNEISVQLENYSVYREKQREYKKNIAIETVNKLRKEGFRYGAALFDEDYNLVTSKREFFTNASRLYGDEIELDNGMTWSEYVNTIISAAGAGAVAGSAVPGLGNFAGGAGGALSAMVVYPVVGAIKWAYNSLFGDGDDYYGSHRFTNGASGTFGGAYTIDEEFDEMLFTYDQLVQDSELITPVPGMPMKDFSLASDGTGVKIVPSGVTIKPGVRTPNYNEFLKLQKIINNNGNLFEQHGARNFVSLNGTEEAYSDDPEIATRNAAIFRALYNDLIKESNSLDSKIGDFKVGVTPFAANDITLGGVILKIPDALLDKYYNASDPSKNPVIGLYDDKPIQLNQAEYAAIKKNGLVAIMDGSRLQKHPLYKNSFMSADEIRIMDAGANGVTYTDPTLPGASINFKVSPADPSNRTMIVKKTVPVYISSKDEIIEATEQTYVRLGANIGKTRKDFFSVEALKIKEDNMQREGYEPAGNK